MGFGHHIPRVGEMTFLNHPACSSGFIKDFLDNNATLKIQKAVSAYLLVKLADTAFGLHGSRSIIGSNVGLIMYMSGDSPFIA